ncbi:hypothetical protein ACSFA0_22495 [Variovorax sp. LT1P1]|uniref:hypothetical protein n=1 Tax=Variovorax sp. LT1P1 TaxID=3443730 RepID=UPI003F48616A
MSRADEYRRFGALVADLLGGEMPRRDVETLLEVQTYKHDFYKDGAARCTPRSFAEELIADAALRPTVCARVIDALLAAGVSVDREIALSRNGLVERVTLLHMATRAGLVEAVGYLLRLGADWAKLATLEAAGRPLSRGLTALDIAWQCFSVGGANGQPSSQAEEILAMLTSRRALDIANLAIEGAQPSPSC